MKPFRPRLGERVVDFVVTVFMLALLLHIAARLIEAVLPVLFGIGAVGLVGFVGWSIYQFRRSRW